MSECKKKKEDAASDKGDLNSFSLPNRGIAMASKVWQRKVFLQAVYEREVSMYLVLTNSKRSTNYLLFFLKKDYINYYLSCLYFSQKGKWSLSLFSFLWSLAKTFTENVKLLNLINDGPISTETAKIRQVHGGTTIQSAERNSTSYCCRHCRLWLPSYWSLASCYCSSWVGRWLCPYLLPG